MRVSGWVASGLLLAACLAAPTASAQGAASLSGTWSGYYGYGTAVDDVDFQVRLRASGAGATGTSVEINTFGNPDVLFLTANISATLGADRAVEFTKTYDGTGGQSHSVQYSGKLNAAGQCILGKWRIGAQGGPFEMCKDVRLVS